MPALLPLGRICLDKGHGFQRTGMSVRRRHVRTGRPLSRHFEGKKGRCSKTICSNALSCPIEIHLAAEKSWVGCTAERQCHIGKARRCPRCSSLRSGSDRRRKRPPRPAGCPRCSTCANPDKIRRKWAGVDLAESQIVGPDHVHLQYSHHRAEVYSRGRERAKHMQR